MTKLTGDFEKAIKESSRVLAIRGQVIPATLNKVSLVARYKDGSTVEGEASIPDQKKQISRVSLNPGRCPGYPRCDKSALCRPR